MTRSYSAEAAKLVYGGVSPPVLAAIPIAAWRILDVGCGNGVFGRAVKNRQPAEVVGLTYSTAEEEPESLTSDR